MANPPRIEDPRSSAAKAMLSLVLMLSESKRVYLHPVEGVPTDGLGYPTVWFRTDPQAGTGDAFLYLDPVGDASTIVPIGGTTLPAATDVTISAAGVATLTGPIHTVRGAGGLADNLDTISGMADAEFAFLVTGAEAITYRDAATGSGNISTSGDSSLVTATGDLVVAFRSGSIIRVTPLVMQAGLPVGLQALARGRALRGSASGLVEAADISALGAILAGDGTDAAVVNLLTAALGGTSFTARAYSGATLQEPPDNATLTAALGSLTLLHRHGLTNLLMDETSPPTATAGRGLVVTGGVVAPQGVPDLTVQVSAAQAFSNLGRYSAPDASPTLGGFTIPAVAGEQRADIVVIEAGGTIVRRVGTEGAAPAADPVLTVGDVPLARVTLTEGADVDIQAGNLTDLRQTAEAIDAAKILSGYPASYVSGSVAAPVPAAGTVALTPGAFNTLTPAGAGAYNLDNMTGLGEGQHAYVRIDNGANPATIRDNAVGAGVIWTRRAASIVLADVHDVALVVCRNARYHVFGLVIQAGQASGDTTATSTAERRVGHVHYVNPIAEEYISIVADVLCANGPQIIAGQPDFPRGLAINITIAVNPITDGDVIVVGVGKDGEAVTQTIDITCAVSTVFYTDPALATVTSVTVGGLTGGGGAGDNIGVGVSSRLALPATQVPAPSAYVGFKTVVDGANEAVAGIDATYGTVDPTTAPNAAHDYDFFYTYQVTPTQNAHSHLT